MRILITGGTGYLGTSLLAELLAQGGYAITCLSRRPHPLYQDASFLSVAPDAAGFALLASMRFDAIFHLAASCNVQACEKDPEEAEKSNVELSREVCRIAEASGARLIYSSTDMVFDGTKAPAGGFTERQSPSARSVYARTKLTAEKLARDLPGSVIMRLSLIYGPAIAGVPGGMDWMIGKLERGEETNLFYDEWRTPIFVGDCVSALLAAARGSVSGLFHAGGPERLSRVELGQAMARHLGFERANINAQSRLSLPGPERPADLSLDSTKLSGELRIQTTRIAQAARLIAGTSR